MKKSSLASILALLSISLFLVQSPEVDARAGGGHSSRSGSSSSSSSSSDGSGLIGLLFWLIFSHPVIGVPAALIIGYIIFQQVKNNPNLKGAIQNIRLNEGMEQNINIFPPSDLEAKMAALRQRDPSFNEQQFLDRTSTAFFKIQNAWCDRDMNKARAYISDNVLRRFSLQLEEHKQNGVANKLEELSLDSTKITDIRSDENFDSIDIWVTATAKDYMVKADTGDYASGEKDAYVTWDERWTFIRSTSAKTLIDKGVTADKCPNCGAPLSVNANGECDYCHSNITKGDFDWVLSEISQLN